jgi:hypothetical protein
MLKQLLLFIGIGLLILGIVMTFPQIVDEVPAANNFYIWDWSSTGIYGTIFGIVGVILFIAGFFVKEPQVFSTIIPFKILGLGLLVFGLEIFFILIKCKVTKNWKIIVDIFSGQGGLVTFLAILIAILATGLGIFLLIFSRYKLYLNWRFIFGDIMLNLALIALVCLIILPFSQKITPKIFWDTFAGGIFALISGLSFKKAAAPIPKKMDPDVNSPVCPECKGQGEVTKRYIVKKREDCGCNGGCVFCDWRGYYEWEEEKEETTECNTCLGFGTIGEHVEVRRKIREAVHNISIGIFFGGLYFYVGIIKLIGFLFQWTAV